MNKLEKAFRLFDAYNQQDPNTLTRDGETYADVERHLIERYGDRLAFIRDDQTHACITTDFIEFALKILK